MTIAPDQPLTVADVLRGGRISLPFPELPGQIISCPRTGAVAVSCNARGKNHPDAMHQPCYAVVKGHHAHGFHLWLTYAEALAEGFHAVGQIPQAVPHSWPPAPPLGRTPCRRAPPARPPLPQEPRMSLLVTLLTVAGGIVIGAAITAGVLAPGRRDLRVQLDYTRARASEAEAALLRAREAAFAPTPAELAKRRHPSTGRVAPVRAVTPPPPPSAPIAKTQTMRKVVPSQRRADDVSTTVFPSVAAASWAPSSSPSSPSSPSSSCDTGSSGGFSGGDCGVPS